MSSGNEARTYAQIKADRQADILAKKPLRPKGECHNCGWKVPPKALWCSGQCAQDHADEKAELQARDGN